MDQIIDGETVLPGGELQCRGNFKDSHEISISIKCKMIKGGEWETSFVANQNTSRLPRNIDMDVTRKFTKCNGKFNVEIKGFVKDTNREGKIVPYHPQERIYNELTFKKSSKSAVIKNNGRSLERLRLRYFGSGITNRLLNDDEIFTVRIDKKQDGIKLGPAIGVTALTLDGEDLKDNLFEYKSGTWFFYHDDLYQNGDIVNRHCLKKSLNEIEVGDSVGVMRSRFGNLHLFIKGVDQGIAASNIPKAVYGLVLLPHFSRAATIINL